MEEEQAFFMVGLRFSYGKCKDSDDIDWIEVTEEGLNAVADLIRKYEVKS